MDPAKHHNCLITGPTGSGKTYLACALAPPGLPGRLTGSCYYYAPKLFRELQTAQADGSLHETAQATDASGAVGH